MVEMELMGEDWNYKDSRQKTSEKLKWMKGDEKILYNVLQIDK